MKKSFKKAIAVLLAVLMVAFSVPFSALAAAGDYTPDVELMFGTFHDADSDWTDYSVANGSDFTMCGLYDAPLTYDSEAGTLTLEAAKAAKADETLGFGTAPEQDYKYEVGDYFTVSVVLKNIDHYAVSNAYVSYSDNIEPAGYYSYRNGRNNAYAVGTVDEATGKSGTFTFGGTAPIENMSANEFIDINKGKDGVDDSSFIDPDSRWIEATNAILSGKDSADCSSITNEFFANPETGDLSAGYTYTNMSIMETFVFKITGEGAIKFDVADPNDTIGAFEGAYFIGAMSDGIMTDDYTTYAPNDNNPGSCKMTFFGKNVHVEEPADHKHTYDQVEVDPTCTEAGKIVYTCNNSDGLGSVGDDTYEQPSGKVALGHDYTSPECVVTPNNDGAKHTVQCLRYDQCGTTQEVECTPVPDTDKNKEASSCRPDGGGWEGATKCEVCGQVLNAGQATAPKAHTPTDDTEKNKPATCTDAGWENATKCEVCGETINEGQEIPALNHEYTGAVDHYDTTGHYRQCARYDACNSVSEVAEPHVMQQIAPEKPAGPGVPGTTAVMKCRDCDYQTGGEEIPAQGVSVTVKSSDLGTSTVQGQDVTDADVTVKVAPNSEVTLKATPKDGAEFVAWIVNGKVVSTEAEHTFTALTNITFEPVFREVQEETFTVVFADMYGNIYNTQTVSSGTEVVTPDGPVIAGYTFTGWSLTDEQIDTLTEATTIIPKYERDTEQTFTVTATGATITTPYATTQDTNTGIGYNTKVTVTAEGAKAWKIDGVTVAYGETYEFYIGSDVVLTFETGAVTETPVVAAISVTEIGAPGALKASFLASRQMTKDATYIRAGFIYGLDPSDENLTLGDVDETSVRAYYCSTNAEQFALNVGRKEQTGKIVARAFLAYSKDGATQVVYAEPQSYTYD